jgi:hypothetical protein
MDHSSLLASSSSSTGSSAASINLSASSQAVAAAALDGIVVDDSLMADVTEEMLEINAFDLLRSLERQASQLQAEAETMAAASSALSRVELAGQLQQQQADDEQDDMSSPPSPPQSVKVASGAASGVRTSGSMSVSVPNLTTTSSEPEREVGGGPTPAAFLESFANVARR